MQQEYTALINFFIETMLNDKAFYLDIFNNNKKAPIIRQLEKNNRTKLVSGFGQNAIDTAVTELHNHFIRIKNSLYGQYKDEHQLFVSSTFLLNATLIRKSLKETLEEMQNLIVRTKENLEGKCKEDKDNSTLEFYFKLNTVLNKLTVEEFELISDEIRNSFEEQLLVRKCPYVKNMPIQLDKRLCIIEKAENVKADFVIRISTLEKRKRIEIPIKTSSNGLRRLNQYKNCSPTICVKGNEIRVAVPFEKKTQKHKVAKTIGVDVGITDLLHLSTGEAIGTFSHMLKLYDETILVKQKNRSNLKNYMRQLQKALKKLTSNKEKEALRRKICHINTMLQGKKTSNRIRRKYNHEVNCLISSSVKKLISLVDKNTLVAIEDIDLLIDDTNKKFNRKVSTWARGKLLKKIEASLAWISIKTERVEPAYTSQLCPKCFNISKYNRNGKVFICTCCGHADDADNNASNNIEERVKDKELKEIVKKYSYSTKLRHKAIKELYLKRHNTVLADKTA